jgi:hypothetical protein
MMKLIDHFFPMIFIALSLLVVSVGAVAIVANSDVTVPVADDDTVKIVVSCGTLRGSGAILLYDKETQTVDRSEFTCPAFKL